jgi:hypothetical protein
MPKKSTGFGFVICCIVANMPKAGRLVGSVFRLQSGGTDADLNLGAPAPMNGVDHASGAVVHPAQSCIRRNHASGAIMHPAQSCIRS